MASQRVVGRGGAPAREEGRKLESVLFKGRILGGNRRARILLTVLVLIAGYSLVVAVGVGL